jgi:polyhydroxybutyrate depolymerase
VLGVALALGAALAGCGWGDDDEGDDARAPRQAAADPCPPTQIRSSVDDLFHGGRARDCRVLGDRRYVLYEPRSLGGAPAAVVLALHGVGGPAANAQTMAEASRLDRLADRERFAVVYGEGVDGSWSDGDVAYFQAVIEHLATRRSVDRDRVYAIGWSAGGFMVHTLGCRLSERVAAIAVLHAPLAGPCRPESPVSVLQIAGSADDTIPYAGGDVLGTTAPPMRAAVARWRRIDGCGRARRSQDGAVVRETASGCDGSTAVELVTIRGGGHSWYGPDVTAPDDSVDATAEAWRFFERHGRGG